MGKTAFLFSGQGSQYPGMGKELYENFKEAKEVYDMASLSFGYDVLRLSCSDDKEELAKTAVSQPLIYTLSMASLAVLKAKGVKFDAVAGFSLGEVSALTAIGAMSLETGFKVIAERATAMQEAAEKIPGAMFAVLGGEQEAVESACAEQKSGYCAPVNYNCPGQIVIAGEEQAVKLAAQSLSDSGLRVVRLSVNAAFHSKLMVPASARFFSKIGGFTFGKAMKPFYSNITGDKEKPEDIPSYLKTQMISPVRFTQEMASMSRDGFTTFVELGPGKTLCGFIRRGLRGSKFCNVENMATVEKCLAAVSAD